jgi:transcriptional regulator
MYIPTYFNETDPARIVALIAAYPLGMLVTVPDGVPFVSYLPFLFEEGSVNSQAKLLGHTVIDQTTVLLTNR